MVHSPAGSNETNKNGLLIHDVTMAGFGIVQWKKQILLE